MSESAKIKELLQVLVNKGILECINKANKELEMNTEFLKKLMQIEANANEINSKIIKGTISSQENILQTNILRENLMNLLLSYRKGINDKNQFKDDRDGAIYKTIQVHKQTWLAENFRYNIGSNCSQSSNRKYSSQKEGLLYNFQGAKDACPKGWKIPSLNDWKELLISFGGYRIETLSGLLGSKTIGHDLTNSYKVLTKTGHRGNLKLTAGNSRVHDLNSYWTSDGNFLNASYLNVNSSEREIIISSCEKHLRIACRYVKIEVI